MQGSPHVPLSCEHWLEIAVEGRGFSSGTRSTRLATALAPGCGGRGRCYIADTPVGGTRTLRVLLWFMIHSWLFISTF
jgi:hypothetical protein